MGISIVVGGQFGSEGKGKVTRFLANKLNAKAIVRVGGCNSGHTVYKDGNKYALKVLPAASVDGKKCILAAGSYINCDILFEEIEKVGLSKEMLKIDENAVIMCDEYKTKEKADGLDRISSTLSGTGAAVASRVMRNNIKLAKDIPELQKYICDTKKYMRNILNDNQHIIIEGTQGYGLSNIHSKFYPCATARDTTAAEFLSETGLSPFDVAHVVMVIRAFPIRVAGNSGPLENETTWEQITKESGSKVLIQELTTVTQRIRRVAYFDPNIVKEAIIANKPDMIFLNHVDYIDATNKDNDSLSDNQLHFIDDVESSIGQQINYIGNGEQSNFISRAGNFIIGRR